MGTKWFFVAVTVAFLGLLSLQAYAKAPLVPQELSGATVLSVEECKKLLEAKVKVFDVRNELEYEDGHLPGAVSLPYKEKSAKSVNFDMAVDHFNLTRLPADKDIPIVFYCNGESCWKSYKASVTAIQAGYKKVFWFKGGFPEWVSKGFPVEK